MTYGSPSGQPQNNINGRRIEGGTREMAEWEKQIFAINLIVGDLERLEDLALFRVKDTYVASRHDPAHQNAPAGEVLGLAQRGVGQFAIVVEDVDAVRAELDEHGVTVISGPADRDWGMRTLTFADPGGYTWGIAQDLP